jgi:hypothetical protein
MRQSQIKLLAIAIIFSATIPAISNAETPWSERNKKEMQHMVDYYISDQTPRNEFYAQKDFDDLTDCPVLIKMGRWEYSEIGQRSLKGKMIWTREQSWRYSTGMVNETGTSINYDENYAYPKDAHIIYVGPWKDIHLEYGFFWNKIKIDKKIRFTAIQKRNDVNVGYLYASYEFMNDQNKLIPEQPIKLAKDLPAPDFERFCAVKWVAKYGYNAVAETKSNNQLSSGYWIPTGNITQAKE